MDNKILNKLRKIKESYLEEDGLRSVLLEDISFIDEVINELKRFYNVKPVAFTIRDDSGYLYLNRMTTQECDELNHQLNLLQKYCPEKQYSITPLYRLDK
ncbi:hypothetical protein CYG68_01965 [Morganella morganii]|uniref:Uncharacterized protein n=2 Tax=Morganella morganii TaxID=582 RepID=A0A8I0PRY4_MORMO|nr:hypothetical protein [Morganella morganii]